MFGKDVTKCKLEDNHSRLNRIIINPAHSNFHLTYVSEHTLAEGKAN